MTKIVATLIAAFFAVTAFGADTAVNAQATNPANTVRTHRVEKKAVVQKSKKKKKTSKHHKKAKKPAATPAQGQ